MNYLRQAITLNKEVELKNILLDIRNFTKMHWAIWQLQLLLLLFILFYVHY